MKEKAPPRFSGKNLLSARKTAGMSRFKLAQAIDFVVHPQTLMEYEQGKRCPRFDTAIRLARALKIPLKNLTDAQG